MRGFKGGLDYLKGVKQPFKGVEELGTPSKTLFKVSQSEPPQKPPSKTQPQKPPNRGSLNRGSIK